MHLDEQACAGAAADYDQPSSSSAGAADAAAARGARGAASSKVKVKQEADSDAEIQDADSGAAAATRPAGGRSKGKQQQQQPRSKQRSRAAAGRRQQHSGDQQPEDEQEQGEVQQDFKQQQLKAESQQQDGLSAVAAVFEHSLQSFKAYADWSKNLHFSCQPCNADLQSVLREIQSSEGPAAKRQKTEAKQKMGRQQQQASETPEPSEYGEDETEDASEAADDVKPAAAIAEGSKQKATAAAMMPERQSSRLQQKSAMKASSRGSAANKGKASAASKPKARAAGATAGKRPAAGANASVASAVQPSVTLEQVEAEFWRIIEHPQPARLVEALVSHVDKDEAAQQSGCISGLLRSRSNMLRYVPLQQPLNGLTAPQLCIGSCLSCNCWQMAQHAMCHISYQQSGAQKVCVEVGSLKTHLHEASTCSVALRHLHSCWVQCQCQQGGTGPLRCGLCSGRTVRSLYLHTLICRHAYQLAGLVSVHISR